MYLPGSKSHLQFQAQDTTAFRPLVAKIVKCLEPFTSSVVLLVQQISDIKQFILKLNDRRLGHHHRLNMEDGELPWTPALGERLRAAVRDIQLGKVTNWFEFVKDTMNPARPHPDDWEDWMWEMSTWTIRMQEHQNEVDAFCLLRRLQGHLIPRYYGLVHLPISPSEPLHPITDYIPGFVIEYIEGVSMGSLQPGVDIPRSEVEAIADRVMDAFRTIKAEQCVMHNDNSHIDRRLSGCALRVQGATEQRAWGVEKEGDTAPDALLFFTGMEPICGESTRRLSKTDVREGSGNRLGRCKREHVAMAC